MVYLSEWGGRLVLQAWNVERNLVRKIARVGQERQDRLTLIVERFPKLEAELQIADLDAPTGRDMERRTSREALSRTFSTDARARVSRLARSGSECRNQSRREPLAALRPRLSPQRLNRHCRSGRASRFARSRRDSPLRPHLARLPAPAGKRRSPFAISAFMCLCAAEAGLAARAAWLNAAHFGLQIFGYDDRDRIAAIDPSDAGNIDSTLPPCRHPADPNIASPALDGLPEEVARVDQSDGSVSLRVRGLEFARWANGRLPSCGIQRRSRCPARKPSLRWPMKFSVCAIPKMKIASIRSISASPEGWLESEVKAHPAAIDASLLPGSAFTARCRSCAGRDRGIIDLVGIDHTGRLVVIELKATEDLQLPFQAIDYWTRVRKHLLAGDFERQGYFPGQNHPARTAAHSPRRARSRIPLHDGDATPRAQPSDRHRTHRPCGGLAPAPARDVPASWLRASAIGISGCG